jgi:hypothetical protein
MVAATIQEPTFSGAGAQTQTGAIAGTLPPPTASMAGAQTQTGAIAATLQKATAAFIGVMQPAGTIVSTMTKATFSATGGQTFLGYIAAALQPATFAGVAVQIYTGTMNATMQAATFAGVGHFDNAGAVLVSIAKSFLVRVGILKRHEVAVDLARTYHVGRIGGAMCLAAEAAVAMGHALKNALIAPADRAAQTVAVVNHCCRSGPDMRTCPGKVRKSVPAIILRPTSDLASRTELGPSALACR